MTSADGLVEFLTARLNDDERYAAEVRPVTKPCFAIPPGRPFDVTATQFEVYGMRRALDEVEAKRTLVAVMATMLVPMPTPLDYPEAARKLKLEVELAEENAAKLTLRLLAQPYRGHPDWREDWAA